MDPAGLRLVLLAVSVGVHRIRTGECAERELRHPPNRRQHAGDHPLAADNWKNFGKVGTFPVDGQVYAQPLYVSGVAIGGATYNVVYVATMHNSIFAFNADTPQSPRRFGK